MAVIAYLSANKAISIKNPVQRQFFFPEKVQCSLSEGLICTGNLKWKSGALDLILIRPLSYDQLRDCQDACY